MRQATLRARQGTDPGFRQNLGFWGQKLTSNPVLWLPPPPHQPQACASPFPVLSSLLSRFCPFTGDPCRSFWLGVYLEPFTPSLKSQLPGRGVVMRRGEMWAVWESGVCAGTALEGWGPLDGQRSDRADLGSVLYHVYLLQGCPQRLLACCWHWVSQRGPTLMKSACAR